MDVFLYLSRILPIRGHHRYHLVKYGGIKILGPCFIYRGVSFDSVAPDLITIGQGVTITQGTSILTHYLDPSKPGRQFRLGEVIIEKDAFLGINVIVCNNVVIGEGAIVGAGSVVTKSIPPYQVWAGNPAKYIKDRVH